MEKQNNNGIVVAFLIFFIVTTLALGGYILYSKTDNTKDNKVQTTDKPIKKEKDSTVNSKKEIQQAFSYSKQANVLVDKEGNAYFQANDSEIQKYYKTYTINDYQGSNGGNQLKAYKLNIPNISKVYCVHIGNGGIEYFIFIKEDNTLSYFEYNETFVTLPEVKDIKNLSNIESIVQESSMDAVAITIDGKKVNLYDYLDER